LQETDLPARRSDQNVCARRHFPVYEIEQQLARAQDARGRQVQVVNEENDVAPAHGDSRVGVRNLLAARRREAGRFARAARRDALEEKYLLRLAVNLQLELVALQALHELPLFINHRHVRLDDAGADAQDFVLRLVTPRRCLCGRRLLCEGGSLRRREQADEREEQAFGARDLFEV
jgi:hypothetical protein